ncbi:MAG: hypothetical protein WCB68_16930 [Pyrinomonadaceae bacterium]
MEESFDTQKLLTLRKVTRAVSDLLRAQMKEYLSTLAPLLRPRTVLGDYVQTSTKETTRGSDKAFKELQSLYEQIARTKPFNITAELKPPVEIINTALEMTPMEYEHEASTGQESKSVIVTSPLKWVLSYSGFSPKRLRETLAGRQRDHEKVKEFLLHYLVMHVVVSNQTGVTQILDALHFPVTSEHSPDFGELPITCISSSISTLRPPDNVIIESTEIAGRDAFEEVINLEDIQKMRNPLKDQLIGLVKNHGEHLLPDS